MKAPHLGHQGHLTSRCPVETHTETSGPLCAVAALYGQHLAQPLHAKAAWIMSVWQMDRLLGVAMVNLYQCTNVSAAMYG